MSSKLLLSSNNEKKLRIPSSMTEKVSSWLNGNSNLIKEVGIIIILIVIYSIVLKTALRGN